ncbi:hypothetical protein AB0F17_62200 [Nonomuraea sp. NPDC026600]|uniref:hypothetical protein n=1 Tax=Nonomuraea sp. NPDC026600 TaxID=3155363 RepID=UPI0033DE99BD
MPEPRAFAAHLHQAGVPNSVGTFGLRAASAHPACLEMNPAACPTAEHAVDRLLAVPLLSIDTEQDLRARAEIIQREATTWEPPGSHPTHPHPPATSSTTPMCPGTPTS